MATIPKQKGGKNNPAFLRSSSINWLGEFSLNTTFEDFDTIQNGIRASLKNMITHYKRGKNTIEKLINTLSPPNENNTASYVQRVARITFIGRNEDLSIMDLARIAGAIYKVEGNTNVDAYNQNTINQEFKKLIS